MNITWVERPFDCYSAESFPFDDPLTDGYWCLVPSGSPLFYPALRFSALVVSALPFVPLSSTLMISSLSDVLLKSRCRENREAKCAAKGINLWTTTDTKDRKTRKRPFQVFISKNPLFSLQKGHKFTSLQFIKLLRQYQMLASHLWNTTSQSSGNSQNNHYLIMADYGRFETW